MNFMYRVVFCCIPVLGFLSLGAEAQEKPYFVTYDHHMEEPGNLEISTNPVVGHAKGINSFIGRLDRNRIWREGVVDIGVLPRHAAHAS
jgi:hypothetical protein